MSGNRQIRRRRTDEQQDKVINYLLNKLENLNISSNNIETLTVTLSAAEVLGLSVAGLDIIESPGANKFINVISATMYKPTSGVAFDGTGVIGIGMNGTSGNQVDFSGINTTNIIRQRGVINGNTFSYADNQPLQVRSGSAITVGDGTLIFYIVYQILDYPS